jgi:formylglycine-generating enzyme required for sulfatase activity
MPSHGRHTGRDIRHGTRKPRAGASTPRDQHEVAIKAFALGKYDVTSEQFLTFLKETGYQPRPCSTILDMKWKSPGHGQAYSPLNEEPPHWPAVCLDWHDAEKYLAWLNDKVRIAHPTLDHSKGAYRLPTEAEWSMPRAPARPRRAGGAMTSALAKSIATAAAASGTTGCSPTSTALPPTPSASTGARQFLAVDRRLLAPKLFGRAARRGRMDRGGLRQARPGGSWSNLPNFVRSAARSGSGRNSGEYDYSSLTGFRVARGLP